MSREILRYAQEVLETEGADHIASEPTRNGHYRLMFNVGNAREMYVIGMRMSSHRTFENIKSALRRKVREARQRAGR